MKNELPNLDKEDTYSVALLLLFVFKNDPKYSTLSELSYVLDHDNFLKFINYYAGQTIKIPSTEEISQCLRVLMMYQYYTIEGLPWATALDKSGFEQDDSFTVRRLLASFKSSIEKYKIGGSK